MIGPARLEWLKALRLLVGLVAFAAAGRLEATPRVALIQTNPDQSGNITALVEARLTAAAKVTLVERQQVEKILHEQQLQAVLSPDATTGRAKFGELLQVDLLVVIQPATAPATGFNVIVAETRQGLRLIHQPIAGTDAEAAATEIESLILAAIEKTHTLRAIFAVPPFISNDLGFSYTYLSGAYAKVVEGELTRQKGVVVVELAEARAVSREIALSSGSDVSRSLPLYVMGEYRTDGPAANRKVKLTLKLMHGEKEIAGGSKEQLTLDQAPPFLQQVADFFVSKSDAGTLIVAEPKIEAAQLAGRAHLLLSIGSWQDALDLAEASLLLDASQTAMHRDALGALIGLLGPDPYGQSGNNLPPSQRRRGTSANNAIRRCIDHLQPYLRQTKIERAHEDRLMSSILIWLRGGYDPMPPELLAKMRDEVRGRIELRQAMQEMMIRVLEDKASRKVIDDTALFLSDVESLGGLGDEQLRAMNMKVLTEFTYLPNEGAVFQPLHNGRNALDPVVLDFYHKIHELPNDDLRRHVDQRFREIEAIRRKNEEDRLARAAAARSEPKSPAKWEPTPEPMPAGGDDARLVKLALTSDGSAAQNAWLPVEGWTPAGKGTDVIWSSNGIFVMKKPGVLRQIDDRAPRSSVRYQYAQPAFDGKYVWFTRLSPSGNNGYTLLAVDPQRETAFQVDRADGLPHSDMLLVAPISPGRVVVVGSFGQTYSATVQLAPNGKHAKVDIIHEFRRVPVAGDQDQWRNGDLIFEPFNLQVIKKTEADGKSRQVAVAWRNAHERSVGEHPIAIDLASGAVRPIERAVDEVGAVVGDDYWVPAKALAGEGPGFRLVGLGDANLTARPTGLNNYHPKQIIEYDGALHIVGIDDQWAIGAVGGDHFRPLKIAIPVRFPGRGLTLRRSEHYGLVGWNYGFDDIASSPSHGSFLNTTVYQIQFAKPIRELAGGAKSN